MNSHDDFMTADWPTPPIQPRWPNGHEKEFELVMSRLSRFIVTIAPTLAASITVGCEEPDTLAADVEIVEGEVALDADSELDDVPEDIGASKAPAVAVDDVAMGPAKLLQKPKLWPPFPSGTSYLCTQGPGEATSHHFNNTRYALDFDTPNAGAARPVVAALAGQVAYVEDQCVEGNKACGGGFGNHVKLSHGGDYYTIYAHLSSVAVDKDAKVGRGQLLGYEGSTGNSQGDHIHFSLHQGNAGIAAISPSVSYRLRDKDVTNNEGFSERHAADHVCGIPGGHTYRSDNACTTVYDTLATAKPILNDTTYAGETCSVGDVDYFKFGGKAGSFSATITSTDESISDCSCAILDAQGHQLKEGGSEGYIRDDHYNGSEGCACSLSNASTDTYYLKVYSQMPGAYLMDKTLP